MLTPLPNRGDSAPPSVEATRQQVRRRQFLTILFATMLALIAGVASAQSPSSETIQYHDVTLQYDGSTVAAETGAMAETTVMAETGAVVDPHHVEGVAIPLHRLLGDARPRYVELSAALSNFDADADPDGWRAEVVLRDRQDRVVVMRSHATFELMPRVPTADHRRYVDADRTSIRWSMPLEFDPRGVASCKLPLRESLEPLLGWSSAVYPQSGSRRRGTRDYGSGARGLRTWSNSRTFVTLDLRNLIGTPSTGEMRVRVSVPTEGVFEAVTPVWIRPSVLVDTQWPYR